MYVVNSIAVEDVPVGDYELPLSQAEILIEGVYFSVEKFSCLMHQVKMEVAKTANTRQTLLSA